MKIIKYLKLLTFLGVISVLVIISATFQPLQAYYTNMPASVVIGQVDFTDSVGGSGSTKFFDNTSYPTNVGLVGVFVDSAGRLIISDRSNSRVLVWNTVPTSNGAPADLVLGQPDFDTVSGNTGGRSASSMSNPDSVYSTGTKLFVNDAGNHRVLIWNTFPTRNGQAADVVVGQTDFTLASTTCDNVTTRTPAGLFVYQDKLIVSARDHRRVMIWNQVPTTNGQVPDLVLGKNNLSDCTTTTVSASNLTSPRGIFIQDGKLFVSDGTANRVLIWNTFPTRNGQAADVVVGQTDFTSNSSGVTVSKFNLPIQLIISNNRVFISDTVNNRVLIFNSVPTSNGASADIVVGQQDFVSNSANQGGLATANSLSRPIGIFVYDNKLLVGDSINARVLIFDNVIATPGLGIDPNPEALSDGRYKLKGNIVLGERSRYSMQWVKVSVNGEGFGNVTSLGGGRDDGPGTTRYDFYHEFPPWVGIDGIDRSSWNADIGYTLKVKASSFNADSSTIFYFFPFKLISFTDGVVQTVKFSVPVKHVQRVRDGVDHFEIHTRANDDGLSTAEAGWEKCGSNMATSEINTETGEVSASIPRTLSAGEYEVKVVAVSKDSNWREDSNILQTKFGGVKLSSSVDIGSPSDSPLQLNNVGGNIVSTYNLVGIKEKYGVSSTQPVFRGIAYANSEVMMVVTNNFTGQSRTYSVKVSPDSSFIVSPILFPNSTIDIYVIDPMGKFNLLPSFGVIIGN